MRWGGRREVGGWMSYTVPDGTRAALSEGGPSRKGFMLSLRDRLRLWLFL